MVTINLGSIEIVSVLVTDRLANITDFVSATHKIVTEDEQTTMVDWANVENIAGLRIDCLIDTTTTSPQAWAEGIYKLYVKPDVAPEYPILGPYEFGVS